MRRMVIRILLVCNLLLYLSPPAGMEPEFSGTAARIPFRTLHTGKKWVFGFVAQHWWTVTGDPNRGHVNLSSNITAPEVAGPQFNLKFTVTPVILAPEWSKRPFF